MTDVNKESLEHLASLARIQLDPASEDSLVKDLQNILDHFKELAEIDTQEVISMTGGTALKNVFREDRAHVEGSSNKQQEEAEKIRAAFPEKENNFLEVPAVFD